MLARKSLAGSRRLTGLSRCCGVGRVWRALRGERSGFGWLGRGRASPAILDGTQRISPGAAGCGDDVLESIHAGVAHLTPQRTLGAPANHQHSGAVHESPEREHEPRLVALGSAEAFRQALAKEIERGPGLVQGRELEGAIEEDAVDVVVFEREFQIAAAGLGEGAGGGEGLEKVLAGLAADRAQ